MSNSLCKYGNKCRNNQKKEKILKITENSITCNNISNSNKKKCITNKLVQNVVSNAVGDKKTFSNSDLNLFKSELDRVCLQKEKNGKFASLDECKTKVELKTDMVFKDDTFTMDNEKSKVYFDKEDKHYYYNLYIDFTNFFNNIFKKKCTSTQSCNNGWIRKSKIKKLEETIIEKFNEKNNKGLTLKEIGKIKQVNLSKEDTKIFLIVRFKIKDFFDKFVWNGKIKNSLRLTKGKIEEALKTKVHGISFLNNNNLFYEL